MNEALFVHFSVFFLCTVVILNECSGPQISSSYNRTQILVFTFHEHNL